MQRPQAEAGGVNMDMTVYHQVMGIRPLSPRVELA
jgi:hypothetical protein